LSQLGSYIPGRFDEILFDQIQDALFFGSQVDSIFDSSELAQSFLKFPNMGL